MSQRKKEQKGQPHYPVEVKDLAVSRLRAGESVATIASEVGCGVGRIYYWRDRWEKTGQQQAELDFLREALRLMKQVRRPTAEPDAPSPTSSSRAGRLSRKAD